MSSNSGVKIKLEEESNDALSSIKSSSVTPSEQNSLAIRKKTVVPERLISDDMGYEVITLYVGVNKTVFNVHKNLIVAVSAAFGDIFSAPVLSSGAQVLFKDDDPDAFKLFIEFLYSRRVPGATLSMDATAKARRVKQLCQFYAFCDTYFLKFEIRNLVMDAIQDGFLLMGKFPEVGLVQAIYANSKPDSKLRPFALAGIYYGFRYDENAKREEFKGLLQSNSQVLDDFLQYDRVSAVDRDPRVRQCYGWEGCAECGIKGPARIDGLGGVFPCEFHIHQGTLPCLKEGSDGQPANGTELVEVFDDGCYLWDYFPDMEWMSKY